MQEAAGEQQQRVVDLLQAYNNVVMLLSEQFVKWDKVISAAEQRKKGSSA